MRKFVVACLEMTASLVIMMTVLIALHDWHPRAEAQTKTYLPTYIIQTTVSGNGTATPINAAVKQGGNKIIRFLPSAGEWIQRVTVNGADVTSTLKINAKTGRATMRITNVQEHLTIHAVYGLDTRPTPTPTPRSCTITVQETGTQYGMTVKEVGTQTITATQGKNKTIKFLVYNKDNHDQYDGYVQRVLLDGVDVSSQVVLDKTGNGKLTLENVQTDHVLTVQFAENPYPRRKTISAKVEIGGEGGKVKPAYPKAPKDSTLTLQLVPNAGYRVKSVYVDYANKTNDLVVDKKGIGHLAVSMKYDTMPIHVNFESIANPDPVVTVIVPTATPTPANKIYTVIPHCIGSGTIRYAKGPNVLTAQDGVAIECVNTCTFFEFKPKTGASLIGVTMNGTNITSLLTTYNNGVYYHYYPQGNGETYDIVATFNEVATPTPTPSPTPTRTPTPTYIYRYITITTEGDYGEVSNDGRRKVIDGSTYYIDMTTYTGNPPVSVTLDGADVTNQLTGEWGNYTLTLSNIRADHAVHVTFE